METICILKVSFVFFAANLEESKKILDGALRLFMKVGIKSVSMDDLARDLGISKKTIYKHFKDKRDLVSCVIDANIQEDMHSCTEVCVDTDSNAVQMMIDISKHVSKNHKDVNPAVIYDLKKYYPSQWKKMETLRESYILECIENNLTKGISEGFFREAIDPKIISHLYITLIRGLMDFLSIPDISYNFQTVHRQMIHYHLYGICTPKGIQYLEQHINEI